METSDALFDCDELQKSGGPTMIQSHETFVLMAYVMNDNGHLDEVFEPRQMKSQIAAVLAATLLTSKHHGVVVWKQSVDPAIGEYGPAEIVFQRGIIPEVG
jgi:hypothetical protein